MKQLLRIIIYAQFFACLTIGAFAQVSISSQWAWMSGNTTADHAAVYGTKGVPAATNKPGSRAYSESWTDASGNLWLFGGIGNAESSFSVGTLNDLWKYDPTTDQWTWVTGENTLYGASVYGTKGVAAPANTPGDRYGSVSWTDASGNLWLFGGVDGIFELNDLWKFNPVSNQWTWVSGDNTGNNLGVYGTKGVAAPTNKPGGRQDAISWIDASGKLWLFGGYYFNALDQTQYLNDLWKYDPATDLWTWVSGDNTPNSTGSFGTKGVASSTNKPNARTHAVSWADGSGNLWLFGGLGYPPGTNVLNDLWKYNIAADQWTWMSGDNATNVPGVYGTMGVAAATNKPGSRRNAVTWKDVSGNLWLFSGLGYAPTNGTINDVWKYDPSTNQWTWVGGGNVINNSGVYGTEGVPTCSTKPGSRVGAVSWTDGAGDVWIFGGASSNPSDRFNDLWKLGTGMPTATTNPASSISTSGATLNGFAGDHGLATTTSFDYGTSPTLAGATNVPATVVATFPCHAASATLTGLAPNTTYYFRAKASNSAGTTLGNILSFTTTPGATLHFDGTNDYVEIPGSNSLENYITNGQLTIEYWINPGVATAQFRDVISKAPTNVAGTSAEYLVEGTPNSLIYQHMIRVFFYSTSTVGHVSVPVTYTANEWQHIAITMKAGVSLKVYRNGVLQGTASMANTALIGGLSPIRLMYDARVLASFQSGTLDELRLWSRELSATEISNNMNCEIPTNSTNLDAYYRFNQGGAGGNNINETTLSDGTSNANHASLRNFTLTGSTSNWIAPGGVIASEINVQGNSIDLVDGDITPSLTDHTDFGNVNIGGNLVRTFTIQNIGLANLNVSSITMTGADAGLFTIGALTPASPIASGNSATFTATFSPIVLGLKSATLHIASNDCNESDYDFRLQGTGAAGCPCTNCRCTDSLELVRLYQATDGANWTNPWNLALPMDAWYSSSPLHPVIVNGRVANIYLENNNLNGTIPNLNLPKLKTMVLADYQLTGTIPDFNLPELQTLFITNTQMSGSIAPFNNLPNLEQLALGINQLSGAIPNFDLPKLTSLQLAGNQLSGTIPNFNLPELENLELDVNQLTGTIPNFNLPKLKYLSLSSNQLSGQIPDFNLPALQSLNAALNQLSGTLPGFSNLPVLVSLLLNQNQLTGSIPNYNHSNLYLLRLINNQLTGSIPDFNLPNLSGLELSSNQLSGSIPGFSLLTNLQGLFLDQNQLTGVIPNFNLPDLTQLQLSQNQLTGTIANFNLPLLQSLQLNNNQLSGSIPAFDFPYLQSLLLNNNLLTGCIPGAIKTNSPYVQFGGDISNNPGLATQSWSDYWDNGTGVCLTCITDPIVTTNANAGPGSLRQAVIDACPGSTITFDMNTVTSPISLSGGRIIIDKNLTIQGPGASLLTVQNTAAASGTSYAFHINAGVTATISGLTISGGNVNTTNFGGGITNLGSLSVSDCRVSNNTASGGGGILNQASLTMTNSTISGNTAQVGGGIYNAGLTLNISNSTISGNSTTADGAGIYQNNSATLNITNSTISGNSSNGLGGGIFIGVDDGPLNLTNTTITNNSAIIGGGVYSGGTGTIKNSIIAGNTATNNPDVKDQTGGLTSSGYNVIGKTDGSFGWTATDLTGTIATPLNPLLGALANNGGATFTHALLPGSPAINAGTITGAPSTDQRSIARPQQGIIDIGAFESRGFTMTISGGNNQSTFVNTAFANPLTVTVASSFGEPVNGGKVTFTAPASGASSTIAGNPATITGGNSTSGVVTANSIAGAYTVSASVAAVVSSVNFNLTNKTCAVYTNNRAYVNASATGANNGSSWTDAFTSLQSAFSTANNCPITEIWVAAGTYKPTNTTDRTVSFEVPSGVNLYGGFAGTETLLSQRNIAANLTILSGDIGIGGVAADNSYHVISLLIKSNILIDGFTVSDGFIAATDVSVNLGPVGAGILLSRTSNITLDHLRIINNTAIGSDPSTGTGAGAGGGIYIDRTTGAFSLLNSVVQNNHAGFGGGMYSLLANSVTINKTIFRSNTALWGGGGLLHWLGESYSVVGCLFENNVAVSNDGQNGSGGGAQIQGGESTSFTNSIFSNNQGNGSNDDGGGAMIVFGGIVNLVNCSMSGNTTLSTTKPNGNSICLLDAGFGIQEINLKNTIVWGTAALHVQNEGTINYDHSIVKGVSGSDPLFVNSADPDGADNTIGTSDDGLMISNNSPALNGGTNTGAPAVDIIGNPRPLTLANPADIGAYEAQCVIPNAVATPSSQTKCSGVAITTIFLSGNVAGTTFNWTRDNAATVTGIAASGSGDISGTLANTTNAPVTVTFTITPTNNGCSGEAITATVLVNPTPNAVATPSSQTKCSGVAITTIVLSGNVSGTTYNWTRNYTGTVAGIAASGSGDISGVLTNSTTSPVTVTFTITPTANGCNGSPIYATVLVNPTPDVVATPASQTKCSGIAITTIILSGNVGSTTFNWTRDNTVAVTGIANNGTGNISGVLTNTTNAPVTVTFTITPTANGCSGQVIYATVLVNPTPNAVAIPASQTKCSGIPISTIVLSGNVAGTTFNWTRNCTGTVTGIAASGSGNISGTLTNTTTSPITVTFTITPTANGCNGSPIYATVLVNPTPNAVATPASQTKCSGVPITIIVLSGNVGSTTFNWTRDNTVAVTGIAGNGSGNISGTLTNTTNAPVTVTFTITPTANDCSGTSITATVLVNPTPNAMASQSSQTICSGGTITTIGLTGGVSGTVYNWTRNYTLAVTGIGGSGSGNISGALTNTTTSPVTVTFTITPVANGCTGSAVYATVIVNPPTATSNPADKTIYALNNTSFSVTATGAAPLVYKWQESTDGGINYNDLSNGGVYSNTNTNTLNLTAVPITMTGYMYRCVVTGDNCNTATSAGATLTINRRPTVITYTGDDNEQYSDQQTLTALLKDQLTNAVLSSKTVTFTIGSQSVSDGPAAPGNGTDASGIASAALKLYQNIGGYSVVSFFAGDATYAPGTDTDQFRITKENAIVDYTGPEFISVPCATCSTTNILLSASIRDTTAVYPLNDIHPGDIRKARVRFVDLNTMTAISGWLTPSLVSPTDSTKGTVVYNWTVALPATGYNVYSVGVIVDSIPYTLTGNYKGKSETVINVSRSTLSEFITGGGNIVPINSNGQYASDQGRKLNFGFNVKYNKSNTKLQGSMNIIFRRGGRVYQIKTTSMNSLSINSTDPCSKKAIFTSKANLQDITNPAVSPVSILGGLTMVTIMTDNGDPGNADKIGVTLWDGNSLVYSSNWLSTQTVEMLLNGGNLIVHNGVNCTDAPRTPNALTENTKTETKPDASQISIGAYPNPFSSFTNIRYVLPQESSVSLSVYSSTGQKISQLAEGRMSAGEHQVRFDASKLAAGFYLYRLETVDAERKRVVLTGKIVNVK